MIAWNPLTRLGSALAFGALSAALGSAAIAQSTAEIVRPVGQVCLAGQPCVGQSIGGATDNMMAGDSQAPADPGPADTSASASAQTGTETAQADSNSAPDEAQPEQTQQGSAPAAATAATETAASDFDVQAAYNRSCMACHMTGAAGAPMLGDAEAWETRMAKGMDAVMQNVYNGIGAMPARGLCVDCTDDQLRSLVEYMTSQ